MTRRLLLAGAIVLGLAVAVVAGLAIFFATSPLYATCETQYLQVRPVEGAPEAYYNLTDDTLARLPPNVEAVFREAIREEARAAASVPEDDWQEAYEILHAVDIEENGRTTNTFRYNGSYHDHGASIC